MMTVRILNGDCRAVLATLPSASVHCIITSPPYYGLRDYGTAQWEGGAPECDHVYDRTSGGRASRLGGGKASQTAGNVYRVCPKCGARRIDQQIGLEPSPDAYVFELVAVFREARRVLRDDGTLFLNLGDSYMSSGARHTGRNDSNRETPGGRGGSFRGGVRRAIACDTSGKAPEGFQASDCLCESLCDGCRKAYRLGKSHSGSPHAPTIAASTSAPSLAHTVSEPAHLPTLGSSRRAGRTASAIRGSAQASRRGYEQRPGAPASTKIECVGQLQVSRSEVPSRGDGCLACGRSLLDCAPASARMEACTCGTADNALAGRMIGTDASGLAYPSYTTASLKPKDLIGIPWRVAFALQTDGWYLRQDIIWAKPNPMPESVTDRCTKAHEYVFLLSKSARYWYDAEAISEPSVDWGPRTRAGKYESGLTGLAPHTGLGASGQTETRNRRSVWTIATQPYGEAHFATMPPDLAELCIKAGTSEKGCCARCGSGWARITDGASYYDGDDGSRDRKTNQVGNGHGGHGRGPKNNLGASIAKTVGWQSSCSCPAHEPIPATVLDPFGGAGTTGLVADRLGRNAVLIELNPDYATMARHRIEGDGGMFSSVLEAAE